MTSSLLRLEEGKIRDKRLITFAMRQDSASKWAATIELVDSQGLVTTLSLAGLSKIDWFDDSPNGSLISHVKCLADSEKKTIVFDPYDERIEELMPEDNMVVQLETFFVI